MPSQDDIDARILDHYETQFSEDARLTTRSAQGPLEFARVQELVTGHVAGGRVLDVALVDPVPSHVAVAQDAGSSWSSAGPTRRTSPKRPWCSPALAATCPESGRRAAT